MAVAGTSEAAQFVEQREQGLYRLAYAITGDAEPAATATYAALGRLTRRWRRITAEASPGPAARRLLVSAVLPRRRRPPEAAYGLAELPAEDRFADGEVSERDVALFRTYAAAPLATRVYLALGLLEDLDDDEVAAAADVPTGQVRRHLADFWREGGDAAGEVWERPERLRRVVYRIADSAPPLPPPPRTGWLRRHTGWAVASVAAAAATAIAVGVALPDGRSSVATPTVTFSSVPTGPAMRMVEGGASAPAGLPRWPARGPLIGDPRTGRVVGAALTGSDMCGPPDAAGRFGDATAYLYYAGMVGRYITVVFGCQVDGSAVQILASWADRADPAVVTTNTAMFTQEGSPDPAAIVGVQPGISATGQVLIVTDPARSSFELARTVSVDRAGKARWNWQPHAAPEGVAFVPAQGNVMAWRLRSSPAGEPTSVSVTGWEPGAMPELAGLSRSSVAAFDRSATASFATFVAAVTGTPVRELRMRRLVSANLGAVPTFDRSPGGSPIRHPGHVLMVAAELPSGGLVRTTFLAIPALAMVQTLEGAVPMSPERVDRRPATYLAYMDPGPTVGMVVAPRGTTATLEIGDGKTSAALTKHVATFLVDGAADAGPHSPRLTVSDKNGARVFSGPVYPDIVEDFPPFW